MINKLIIAIISVSTLLAVPRPLQTINPPDPLDKIIDELATCESRQIPDVVIVDTNGLKSSGWLMFQQRTFAYYGEKYNLPHTDILDPSQQIPIAKVMLRDGHWNAWFNCLKKYRDVL